MLKISLCIFLITSIWRLGISAQALPPMGYFAVIRQIGCEANSKYISKAICKANPPQNRSIYAELVLLQKITSLNGHLEISIPNPKKRKFQKAVDVTFELCKVLRERKRQTLLQILSTMTCLGNKTMQCPIYSGRYHAQNITIVESLPPFLTESDFLIRFNWFLPKIASVLNISVLGRLHEKAKELMKKRKFL